MGFKCGIIGLPNVGKSTLFNSITNSEIDADNFPFCTIQPNIGIAKVLDNRLDSIAEIVNPKRIIPTSIQFVDIAGLVKGASKGSGLGNQFLSHIRDTDAIAHVVRCFKNDKISHITGEVNPINDIEIINTELILADFETCEKSINQEKKKKSKEQFEKKLTVLNKCVVHLEQTCMLHSLDLNYEEKNIIKNINFLTMKPMMYIANIDDDNHQSNDYFNQVYKIANKQNTFVIPVCIKMDYDISKLDHIDRNNYIYELGLQKSALSKIIITGYNILGLKTFFTVGVNELRAWTIKSGNTAIEAAGKIHTDFIKGFIRAKTISYKDFIMYKGENGAKEAGKMRFEGKEYIVQDGDIMEFLFNV